MSYLLVYQKGTAEDTDTRIILRRSPSAAYGQWSAEEVIVTPATGEAVKGPNIVKLNDGRLLLVYNRVLIDPVTRLGIYFRLSEDDGLTWSSEGNVPIAACGDEAEGGPIIELASGTWLCPWWGTSGGAGDCGVIFSVDDGENWINETTVGDGSADGRSYLEPNVIEMANGDYLMSIRENVSSQIWFSTYDHILTTWSAPATGGFAGTSAARMCQLSTGQIVIVYRRDDDGDKPAINTSDDNGASWNSPLTIMHDQGQHTYGGIVELPDDRIAVAYGVQWSTTDGSLHCQILDFDDLP